jgi:glucosylceramidase
VFNTKLRNVFLASAFLGWGCGTSDGDPDSTANSVSNGPTTSAPATESATGAATPGATTTGPTTVVTGNPTTGVTNTPTTNPSTVPTPGSNTGTGTGTVASNVTPPASTPTTVETGAGGTGATPTESSTTEPPVASGGTANVEPPGGTGGSDNPGPVEDATPPNLVVTSADNAFWTTGEWTEAATGSPNVTVNDTAAQKWDGFGGAFNELGWTVLTSAALQEEAIKLLFSATDGANLTWGRIPMGASDYAKDRYTCDDTGTDVEAASGDANRPAADTALANFSLERDGEALIPYIKAAQALKPELRFWASPWTPPVWMKTGFKTNSGGDSNSTATRPSYFDGGSMKSDAAILTAYAGYYTKFVTGYKEQDINIEIVSPQNEPGYDQNYPSCLWDSATYTSFVGQYLGPAMKLLDVQVMLGTMSNAGDGGKNDTDIANAVLADATAKTFVTVAGAQWGVLDKVKSGTKFGDLPIWATEHKCGNYPWNPQGAPEYNKAQAPNDMAYGVESWEYMRDAINKGKVTSYNAWNMVLDKSGLGNDTSRDWKQNSLLVSDGGMIKPTPYYYVFRHLSQYVTPGATVLSAGDDAVAFKNPNGSLVAVVHNSGAANPNYIVSIGGKNVTFAMPGAGWATVKVTP